MEKYVLFSTFYFIWLLAIFLHYVAEPVTLEASDPRGCGGRRRENLPSTWDFRVILGRSVVHRTVWSFDRDCRQSGICELRPRNFICPPRLAHLYTLTCRDICSRWRIQCQIIAKCCKKSSRNQTGARGSSTPWKIYSRPLHWPDNASVSAGSAVRSVTLNLANKFSQCTLALLNTMTYLAS